MKTFVHRCRHCPKYGSRKDNMKRHVAQKHRGLKMCGCKYVPGSPFISFVVQPSSLLIDYSSFDPSGEHLLKCEYNIETTTAADIMRRNNATPDQQEPVNVENVATVDIHQPAAVGMDQPLDLSVLSSNRPDLGIWRPFWSCCGNLELGMISATG